MHSHTVASTSEIAYSAPVSRRENRAAHGNICQVDTCKCGATRRINVNGSHREQGAWAPPAHEEIIGL